MRAVVLAFLGIRRKFSKFIEDYEFVPPGEPLELSTVARMIGNAVPVRIGELLGKSILAHLSCDCTKQLLDRRRNGSP